MKIVKKLLLLMGIVWASPYTVLNFLLHVGPMWALQAYEYVGRKDAALVWTLRPDDQLWWGVRWIKHLWKGWAANSIGNLIVFHRHPALWKSAKTLAHELEHTDQAMRLGPFLGPAYLSCYLVGSIIRGGHAYHDNPCEIAARRRAGQIVDVIGAVEQLRAK